VTVKDIPVLIEMLDDRDHVVQIAAADVLVLLGPDGVEALTRELKATEARRPVDWTKADTIREALESRVTLPPE
jgi:HEAT repeat protein